MIDLNLDLLVHHSDLRVRNVSNERQVWDPVRKIWAKLNQEEFVRQLLIQFLIKDKRVNRSRISVEKGVKIDGVFRRYDLVVFDKSIKPILLIECKSMKVSINQQTFDQILHYNMTLNVPHLFITNGVNSYCCIIDQDKEKLIFKDEVPPL